MFRTVSSKVVPVIGDEVSILGTSPGRHRRIRQVLDKTDGTTPNFRLPGTEEVGKVHPTIPESGYPLRHSRDADAVGRFH